MKRVANAGKVIANRFGLRRRWTENAETGQRAQRRPNRSMLPDLRFRGTLSRRVGFRHDPAQHIDEDTRQRQIRPGGVGGHVEQDDETFAAPLSGDERGSVGETRPRLLRQSRLRLGEHLTRHRHFVRRRKAKERAAGLECGDVPRGLPGQCAA